MFRNLLLTIFALAAAPALLQAQAGTPNTQAAAPIQTPHPPVILPPQAAQSVAPDAPYAYVGPGQTADCARNFTTEGGRGAEIGDERCPS